MKKVLMFTIADWLMDPKVVNGEREYMSRLLKALHNLGMDYIIADSNGNVYDYDKQCLTGQTHLDFDVQVTFCNHYSELPVLDTYTMMALWNPLIYLVHTDLMTHFKKPKPTRSAKFFETYDAYDDWQTPSPKQSDIFQKYIGKDKACFDEYPLYLPSVSKSNILPPADKFEKIFYVGVGWDSFIPGKVARHVHELSSLSDQGLMDVYGPKQFWEERADELNYKGEIPADGETIFSTIRSSGITLALASPEHVDSDIATNRVFEGIASGSIVISNIRGQVYEMFGDNILYVDALRDEEQRLQQILDHHKWIQENTDKVREMVANAQNILAEKYCLEALISNIVNQLDIRKQHLKNARELPIDQHKTIDVAYVCPDDVEQIHTDLNQILKQNYQNINIHVFSEKHKSLLENIKPSNPNHKIIIIEKYFDNAGLNHVFEYLYQQNNLGYVNVFRTGTTWKHNFLSILSKLLVENPDKKVAIARSTINHMGIKTEYGVRDVYEYNDVRYYDYHEIFKDIHHRFTNISSLLFDLSHFTEALAPTTWSFLDRLSGLYMVMFAIHHNTLIDSQYILSGIHKLQIKYHFENLTKENRLILEYVLPYQPRQFVNDEIIPLPTKTIIEDYTRNQYMDYKDELKQKGIIGKLAGFFTLREYRSIYKYWRAGDYKENLKKHKEHSESLKETDNGKNKNHKSNAKK